MAFTRPTLRTIIDRIRGDFKSGLSLQTILRRSFLWVFGTAFGGASHTLHGHIQSGIEDDFFPDTGSEKTVIRWGTLYKLPRKVATFAELVIDVTGTTGGTLPVNEIFVRSDGVEYKVKDEVIIPASTTLPATIVCLTAGDTGNMLVSDTISLQSAIAGIDSNAVVTSITIEGEDLEELELYRARVLQRLGFPPSGGTVSDYISYVTQTPGVTRAWVSPGLLGEGTVVTYGVEDDEVPIIPDAAKVQEIQEKVDSLKPISADHTAAAPVAFAMNPQIQLKPNTTATQAAVTAELADLLAREAQVKDSIDPDQAGLGVQFDGEIKLSQINEAISIADGETDHVLDLPTADVDPGVGGLVVLGTPVFITLP